jgi:uncharacterized membrane protein
MYALLNFLHTAAAIVWLGGMGFMLAALRPVVITQLKPPVRLPLLSAVLTRFFVIVWISIGLLIVSGFNMLTDVGIERAPLGQHLMLGIGLLMFALFAYLFFAPFRRLKLAVMAGDWPLAGQQIRQIHWLVVTNFTLGWIALAAVLLVR